MLSLLRHLMVIQTGSPLPLASTIFCFRRYLVEANCRDFRQHDKGEMANARITASIIYRRNDSIKIYDKIENDSIC